VFIGELSRFEGEQAAAIFQEPSVAFRYLTVIVLDVRVGADLYDADAGF